MRAAVVACLALAACHPQPRRVHEKRLPVRVEIAAGGWVDRDAGRYQLHLACYEPRAETWCEHGCATHVERTPVPCPDDPVTATSASGAVATALPAPDGRATLEFGVAMTDEIARFAIGDRVLREPPPAPAAEPAFAPPSSAAPLPPPPLTRRRSYVAPMLLADGGLLAGVFVLSSLESDSGSDELAQATGFVFTVAYLGIGAAIHAGYGNRTQAGLSVLRRLFFPVIGGVLGYAAFQHDCSDGDEFCGLDAVIGMALGMSAGMLTAMIWDAARAHVTVTAAPIDHGGTVGVLARF